MKLIRRRKGIKKEKDLSNKKQSFSLPKSIIMIYIFNEYNTLDQYAINVKNINYSKLRCPTCGAIGNFKIHGYYNRNIIYLSKDKINNKMLKIQVIKCKSCKHTHAL